MIRKEKVDIAKVFREGTLIDQALRAGVREALRRHKLLGESIIVWRDGQIVELPPEEIDLGDDESPPRGSR